MSNMSDYDELAAEVAELRERIAKIETKQASDHLGALTHSDEMVARFGHLHAKVTNGLRVETMGRFDKVDAQLADQGQMLAAILDHFKINVPTED